MKTKGAVMGVAYRLGFIVAVLFLGYKMVLLCSRNVFLQDYLVSLQPPIAVSSQAPEVSPEINNSKYNNI